MSINKEALEDLDANSVIDTDLIEMPNHAQAQAVVIQTSDEPKAIDPVLLEQLPQMDVSIKVVEDQNISYLHLKDIEADILAQESIDLQTAHTLSASLEGIVTDRVPLESYTRAPSKTNYQHVLKTIKQALALEQANMLSSLSIVLDMPLQALENIYKNYIDKGAEILESQLQDINALALSSKQHVVDNKNTVFPYKGEFINIKTADLRVIDSEIFVQFASTHVQNAVKGFQKVFECPLFCAYFTSIIESKDFSHACDLRNDCCDRAVNILDVLDFYASTSLAADIEHLKTSMTDKITRLNQLNVEGKLAMVNPEKSSQFITEHTTEIQDIMCVVSKLGSVLNSLAHFNAVSTVIIAYFNMIEK